MLLKGGVFSLTLQGGAVIKERRRVVGLYGSRVVPGQGEMGAANRLIKAIRPRTAIVPMKTLRFIDPSHIQLEARFGRRPLSRRLPPGAGGCAGPVSVTPPYPFDRRRRPRTGGNVWRRREPSGAPARGQSGSSHPMRRRLSGPVNIYLRAASPCLLCDFRALWRFMSTWASTRPGGPHHSQPQT